MLDFSSKSRGSLLNRRPRIPPLLGHGSRFGGGSRSGPSDANSGTVHSRCGWGSAELGTNQTTTTATGEARNLQGLSTVKEPRESEEMSRAPLLLVCSPAAVIKQGHRFRSTTSFTAAQSVRDGPRPHCPFAIGLRPRLAHRAAAVQVSRCEAVDQ